MTVTPELAQITVAEAAKLLDQSIRQTQRQVQDGAIPHSMKLPGTTGAYLIDLAVIHKILHTETQTALQRAS